MCRVYCFLLVLLMGSPAWSQTRREYDMLREMEMRSIRERAAFEDGKKLSVNPKTKPVRMDETECLSPTTLEEGQTGHFSYWQLKVLSVVDNNNVLLNIGNTTLWLEDFKTTGLVDGQIVFVIDPIVVGKVKKYQTAAGSSKSVRSFKLLSEKEQKEKEIDKHRKECEKFAFADGSKVDAKFIGYEKKTVQLLDADMNTIKKPLTDFDAESKAKIMKLIKQSGKSSKNEPAKKR